MNRLEINIKIEINKNPNKIIGFVPIDELFTSPDIKFSEIVIFFPITGFRELPMFTSL